MSLSKYNKCLKQNNKINLCRRGYCSAKTKYNVYPSAYANGYASSVCKGEKADYLGYIYKEDEYMDRIEREALKNTRNSLRRWYKEQWVNVCEKGDGPGGYKVCGSGDGLDKPSKYPYCRAYYKYPDTTVVTAPELSKKEINELCKKKRSFKRKPKRIILSKHRKNSKNKSINKL